ncbi:unnamed protein product [Rhodiola kirilowii]
MSMVGEMNYFLRLQVIQKEDGIFISQSKYAKNLIKKFELEKASHKRTPAATHLKITKDDVGTKVDPDSVQEYDWESLVLNSQQT